MSPAKIVNEALRARGRDESPPAKWDSKAGGPNALLEGNVAQQTERVLDNLKAILTHARLTLSHVVKTTVFLEDMNEFAAMNVLYAKYFPVAAPARSTVQVAGLPKHALVEIELVAVL